MRSFAISLSFLALSAAACTAGEPNAAGMETSACLDGACFGDLMCLSDVCVAPEDTSGAATDGNGGTATVSTSGTGPTTTGPSTTSPSTTSPSTTAPATTDTTPPDDTGSTGEPTTGLPPGACAEVDVLFVVDNSGSMVEEQGRLAAAAPGFMDELVELTGSVNPHVMVINVERPVHPCDLECQLFQTCNAQPEFVCGTTPEPTTCEEALGVGVGASPENECGFSSGGRYLDSSQRDLNGALDCALGLGAGTGSGLELTMESMVEAIDTMGLARECNEGFLRDDALLFIVFATDEDDDVSDSAGNPAEWKVRLVEAKGNDEDSIFVLGLFGDNPNAGTICLGEAEHSARLTSFVGLWGDQGISGSVCAPDYEPSFEELLDSVAASCR